MIPNRDIPAIASRAARALGRSLNVYWPADENGDNDSDEKLLSFHFGHVFMNDAYAVFPEADHPDPACQGIDLLAISPSRQHFVACEFKRYLNNTMARSLNDLERVATFRLNNRLKLSRTGAEPLLVLDKCQFGIGIVAGINWAKGDRTSDLADTPQQQQFNQRISELGGTIGAPELVRRYNTETAAGAYFLYYAFLPVWNRETV